MQGHDVGVRNAQERLGVGVQAGQVFCLEIVVVHNLQRSGSGGETSIFISQLTRGMNEAIAGC